MESDVYQVYYLVRACTQMGLGTGGTRRPLGHFRPYLVSFARDSSLVLNVTQCNLFNRCIAEERPAAEETGSLSSLSKLGKVFEKRSVRLLLGVAVLAAIIIPTSIVVTNAKRKANGSSSSDPADSSLYPPGGDKNSPRPPLTVHQREIDGIYREAVQKNEGYGAGIARFETTALGVLYEGAWGQVRDRPFYSARISSLSCLDSMPTHLTLSLCQPQTKYGSKVYVQPNATFEVASVTKAFTATATVLLALRGVVGLDDTLDRVVPELLVSMGAPSHYKRVTLRQLMHHTRSVCPSSPYAVPPKALCYKGVEKLSVPSACLVCVVHSGLSDYWDSDDFLAMFNEQPNKMWKPLEVWTYIIPTGSDPNRGRGAYA